MLRHTHRQFLGFVAWIRAQWNVPDRHDHYSMRIAQRVQQVLAKDPNKVTLESQQLHFEPKRSEPTPQERAAASKARWVGWAADLGATVVEVSREYFDGA